MQIRSATVNDAQGIVALNTAQNEFGGWFRNPFLREGACEYESLTPFQRMLHGGYWMDMNLCRRHLHEYITRGFPVFVAEEAGKVVGECELWLGDETAPFGKYAEIEMLISSKDTDQNMVERALIRRCEDRCAKLGISSLDVSPQQSGGSVDYSSLGFSEIWDTRECTAKLDELEEPDFDFITKSVREDEVAVQRMLAWDHREPATLRFEVMLGVWPPLKLASSDRHDKRVMKRVEIKPSGPKIIVLGWSPDWTPQPTTWVGIWSPLSTIRKKAQAEEAVKAAAMTVERLGKNKLVVYSPKKVIATLRELGFKGGEKQNPWLRKTVDAKAH